MPIMMKVGHVRMFMRHGGWWQAAQHGRKRRLRTGAAVIRKLSRGGSRKAASDGHEGSR
jgi:hypothetical protein